MANAITAFRRSRRRDDARWFYACSAHSLRSLGPIGALLMEVGPANSYALGVLAAGLANEPTPEPPNTAMTGS